MFAFSDFGGSTGEGVEDAKVGVGGVVWKFGIGTLDGAGAAYEEIEGEEREDE